MIGRLWKTGLKTGRCDAYETFARDISLPMFHKQEGFLGCVMFRSETEATVLTLWRDMAAVASLDTSPMYKETVAGILEADLLTEPQSVSVGTVHLSDFGTLDPNSISSARGPIGDT
ncbi:antibiotic biosynthesis monooxygenase family protein [Chelativorans salis]|uniref:ABM domain-containing protein n=1 Tax=Chelativorans salis TaxID=2978478 RepID=A0ABT2LQF4_9HYPH|nr:hypothetical protein [Chelativorans sp. EGI FJ00035]MCT7376304.1 hypothetical protein [Chelativorans sp. EGI FJ00035]